MKQKQANNPLSGLDKYSRLIGVSVDDMMSRCRLPEYVIARQVWWHYLSSKDLGYTYIGMQYGFNYSTVIHGVTHAENLIEAKDYYAMECVKAIEIINKNQK